MLPPGGSRGGSSLVSSGFWELPDIPDIPWLVAAALQSLPQLSYGLPVCLHTIFPLCPNFPLLIRTPVLGQGLSLIFRDHYSNLLGLQQDLLQTW